MPGFSFEPVGWWDAEEELRFYAPADPAHVSHSAVNLQGTDRYFLAPVTTVRQCLVRRADRVPDVIKMDIEGAEYRVLRSMLSHGVLPRVLLVEFNQPTALRRPLAAVEALQRAGYRVGSVEDWNVTFVRDRPAQPPAETAES